MEVADRPVSLDAIAQWLGKSLVPHVAAADLTDFNVASDVMGELCEGDDAPIWWAAIEEAQVPTVGLSTEEAFSIWVRILAFALSEHQDRVRHVEEFQLLNDDVQEELMLVMRPHVKIRESMCMELPDDITEASGPKESLVSDLQNQVLTLTNELRNVRRQTMVGNKICDAHYEADATTFDLQQMLQKEKEQNKELERKNACYAERESEYNKMNDQMDMLRTVQQDCTAWKNKAEKYLCMVESVTVTKEQLKAAEDKNEDLQAQWTADLDKLAVLEAQVNQLNRYKEKANDFAVKLEDHHRLFAQKEAQLQEALVRLEDVTKVSDGYKEELLRRNTNDDFKLSGDLPLDGFADELKQTITKLEDENRRLRANMPKVDIQVELETLTHTKNAFQSRWQAAEEKVIALASELEQCTVKLQLEQKQHAEARVDLKCHQALLEELKCTGKAQQETIDHLREAHESAKKQMAAADAAAQKQHKEEMIRIRNQHASEKKKLEAELRQVFAEQKKDFNEDLERAEKAHHKAMEEAAERHTHLLEELEKHADRAKANSKALRESEAVVNNLKQKLAEETIKLTDAVAREAAIAESWQIQEEGFNNTHSVLEKSEMALKEKRRTLKRELLSLQKSNSELQSKLEDAQKDLERESTVGSARRRELEERLKEEQGRRLQAEALCKVQEDQSSANMEKLKWMAMYNESVSMREREQQDWREKYQALKGQYDMLSKVYEDTKFHVQTAETTNPTAEHLLRRVNELESERREMMLGTAAHLRELRTPAMESPLPVRPPAGLDMNKAPPQKPKPILDSPSTSQMSTPQTKKQKNGVQRSILKKNENDDFNIPIAEDMLDKPTPPPKAEVLRELKNMDNCNQQ
eukprot:GEMP01004111.1.p1 GENE.GEMP01004111.1~~GEMP01004111.1.p1  ORF type:complete len:867 (+),score=218.52 GEMP01004111.1:36-2636(+)